MYLLTVLTFLSLLLFLAAEKSLLHFSRTARRAFWYLLSCAIGVSLVRALQTVEGFGMVWVFLSAVLAASVVEDEVRKKLGLTTMDIDASKRLLAAYHSPEAQGKAERLMDIVGAINKGQGYTAGTKQLLLRMSGTRRRLQRTLHGVLEDAEARELNYILCAINAPALMEIASTSTIDMLVGGRLGDLTTVARAVLIDALQKLGLRYRTQRQLWAKEVLLHTHGMELTFLKAYLDDGGDYHTMYKLAYHDLQGTVQKEVLDHLTHEGRAVVAQFAAQCPTPSPAPPGVVLKVLSDIDDTLFSSGGTFPAGADTRYPRKCFYPGAMSLYAELDRCFAKRYAGALRNALAGVPPMSPRPQLERTSPSKPPPASASPAANGSATEGREEGRSSSDGELDYQDVSEEVEGVGEVSQARRGWWRRQPEVGGGEGGSDRFLADPPPFGLASLAEDSPLQGDDAEGADQLQGNDEFELGNTPPAWEGGEGNKGGGGPEDRGRTHHPDLRLRPAPRISTMTRRVNAEMKVKGLHQEGSNLVFLSARPESYKGMTESESYKKYFQPMVLRGQLDTAPTMLLGSLDAGPRAIAKYLLGWRPPEANPATATSALYQTLAAKKLSRAREYAAIYPEACFIVIGDNGQGDVLCAEILWSSMRAGAGAGRASRLLACLMHKVVPLSATYSMLRSAKGSKEEWKAAWRERDIYFSSTHVGMAVQALSLGLIDIEALQRVGAAAVSDFRQVYARYNGRRSGKNLGKALKHLNKDLAAANVCLPQHLQLPLLPPLPIAGQQVQQQEAQAHPADQGAVRWRGRRPPPLQRPLSPARSDGAWSDISVANSNP